MPTLKASVLYISVIFVAFSVVILCCLHKLAGAFEKYAEPTDTMHTGFGALLTMLLTEHVGGQPSRPLERE